MSAAEQRTRGEAGSNRLLTVVLAGLGAALVGGIAWGLLVRWTDREWGVAAWAIGGLVGAVVVRAAQPYRGRPFQLIAVVCAVLGVVLGKYLEVAWGVVDLSGERLGVFSSLTWEIFTDRDSGVWSWYDAIWFAAAVFTAYRMPGVRAGEHEPAPAPLQQQAADTSWVNPPPEPGSPDAAPAQQQPPPRD